MDCKEFEELIHDYFSDPDFDWKLREKVDQHYLECDDCFETYQIAKLMADNEIKSMTAQRLALDAYSFDESKFTVLLDGIPQTVKMVQGVILSTLNKAGKVLLKEGKRIIFEKDVDESIIFSPKDLSLSHNLEEREPTVTEDCGEYTILLIPGEDGGELMIFRKHDDEE